MNERILIVEDEPDIRELVSINLQHAGYQVSQAADASAALTLIDADCPDMLVLDWMLPGMSGIDLAKILRDEERTRLIPIILLTARAQEGDKLEGFDAGVDDYLTKPFSPRELIARVKALTRRIQKTDAPDGAQASIALGDLKIDPETRRAWAKDVLLALSPTEFKLLTYFMQNPERVLSRAKLLDAVWGDGVYVEERTVDVHIRRLRLCLRASALEKRIETVRGGGYRFNPSAVLTASVAK